jgi:hypothetical protein
VSVITGGAVVAAAPPVSAPPFRVPYDIAVPIDDFVYISDSAPCINERISHLRWRSDKSLEICTTKGWSRIELIDRAHDR